MNMVSFKQNNQLCSNLDSLKVLEYKLGSQSDLKHRIYNVLKRLSAPSISLNRVYVLSGLPRNC